MSLVLERFVKQALARKRSGDKALLTLLRWVAEWEDRNKVLWRAACRGTSHRTFGSLLEHYNIISRSIYARYRRACKVLGIATVESIGLDAACQIARLSERNDQQAAARRILVWIRDEGQGAFPSTQRVVVLIKEVFPNFAAKVGGRVQRAMSALQAENARLREENARLREENARLRANTRFPSQKRSAHRSSAPAS